MHGAQIIAQDGANINDTKIYVLLLYGVNIYNSRRGPMYQSWASLSCICIKCWLM